MTRSDIKLFLESKKAGVASFTQIEKFLIKLDLSQTNQVSNSDFETFFGKLIAK